MNATLFGKNSTLNKSPLLIVAMQLLIVGTWIAPPLALAYKLPSTGSSTARYSSNVSALHQMSKGVSEIAERSSSAVVFVSVAKVARNPFGNGGQFNPFDFWFPELKNQSPQSRKRTNPKPQKSGIGSGFFVDLDKGYVITNNHVVEGADEISLKLANGESYDAKVVGRDQNTDIAVVQIKNKKFNRRKLSSLVLADSDELKVGEFSIALGAPFGLESSISFGVISALGRGNLKLTQLGNFIQTDSAINPGNSGGPLVNMQGKVIGVNTAIFSQAGGYNGIGFAVPSNIARRIAGQLINKGKVDRGYIGVTMQSIDEKMTSHLGLPKGQKGVMVTQVVSRGPAAKAGLKEGDVITEVGGKGISSPNELANQVGLKNPGDRVSISAYRDGKKKSFSLKIQTYPDDPAQLSSNAKSGKGSGFGLELVPLNRSLKAKYNVSSSSGALVSNASPGSAAFRYGLREGDVIVEVRVNRKRTQVRKPSDFHNATRGNEYQFLAISK
jgi:serine protease Do